MLLKLMFKLFSFAVLLEGSPGVGKTSLVIALAEYSGHNVVRINLSEQVIDLHQYSFISFFLIGSLLLLNMLDANTFAQTDMMDLLGSDLPVEGENGMEFAWSDGILLQVEIFSSLAISLQTIQKLRLSSTRFFIVQALKDGSWVLLDELNLAPQSVLEALHSTLLFVLLFIFSSSFLIHMKLNFQGLNSILDHRAEVYIPELGQTYKCPASFRVFACQNPSSQGGGRKGLPKSFLNRFIKVGMFNKISTRAKGNCFCSTCAFPWAECLTQSFK